MVKKTKMGGKGSGRRPKPTALKRLQGNPGKRRINADEPKPGAILGFPPLALSSEEKQMWAELAAQIPEGVATNADRIAFEVAVKLGARMRHDGIGGRSGISVGELGQLNNLLGRFGLTPADRSRIHIAKHGDAQDPLDNLISGKTANDVVQ